MTKCKYCGRFYKPQKDDKMCNECKSHYSIAFEKLKNNYALPEVLKRLADR